ncbi:hypothetical protein KGP36_03075 [Patescibacteria group bacterium]|nr:hypothetical protein [Patescibacteria group bacterium]
MAGDIQHQHRQIFKDLLTICQLRGRDSTGVVRVTGNNEPVGLKRVGVPEFLLETKAYDTMIDQADTKVLIGHCRAKTYGGVNIKNAHPFEHGNIIGVHNGTLKGHYSMERYRDFDVDSDLLYWHISEYGVDATIPKLDEDGAWALVWWDKQAATLNFLKNKSRPLYFTYTKDMKVMFWASEPWWFGAVSRKTDLWAGNEEGHVFLPLENDKLMSFEINKLGVEPNKIFTLKTMKELKGEVRGYTGNYRSHGWTGVEYHGSSHNGGQVADPFKSARESAKTLLGKLDDSTDDIPFTMGSKPLPLPPRKPVGTQTPGVSGSTAPSVKKSETSSLSHSASPTALTSSISTARPKLSLVSNASPASQQGSSESTSGKPSGTCMTSKAPSNLIVKTSLREVAGLEFITDHKTGREWETSFFDEQTGGCCCFCREPIGDLAEVEEIFIRVNTPGFPADDDISFICSSCLTSSNTGTC